MRADKKAAKERALAIKSSEDLRALLDSLNITDRQREIAEMVLARGWSYAMVSAETGYSIKHIQRQMERVYLKMA